jgi:hypothetical protein
MHTVLTLTRLVHVSDWSGLSVLSRCTVDWLGVRSNVCHCTTLPSYFQTITKSHHCRKCKNLDYKKKKKPPQTNSTGLTKPDQYNKLSPFQLQWFFYCNNVTGSLKPDQSHPYTLHASMWQDTLQVYFHSMLTTLSPGEIVPSTQCIGHARPTATHSRATQFVMDSPEGCTFVYIY